MRLKSNLNLAPPLASKPRAFQSYVTRAFQHARPQNSLNSLNLLNSPPHGQVPR
nr:MAG TPA_asm: hypothetical protein [Caudoviricetes sp.]